MPRKFTSFSNARLCRDGKLVPGSLVVSNETGEFVDGNGYVGTDAIDCQGAIIAPGFIELQTNGLRGFHFTHFQDEASYAQKLNDVATYLPSTGVTSFYVTIPTVASDEFKKVRPLHVDNNVQDRVTLTESKKGAHNATLFHPASASPHEVYGPTADNADTLKLVTVAPELDGLPHLVKTLTNKGIRVSLGHSNASYSQGIAALNAGATCLTHTLNAMAPLHHRDPGLAGLVSAASSTAAQSPFFSIIPDGNHLHPSVATMLFRSNPQKCIFITDSIEMAGLRDGTYPGHSQIPHNQTKQGTRVVIEGTDTLIGGCASLQECVQNMIRWSDCSIAEAVSCVSENIANLMGDTDRGKLESGRRADFVVLDEEANVLQTWIGGEKVYEKT